MSTLASGLVLDTVLNLASQRSCADAVKDSDNCANKKTLLAVYHACHAHASVPCYLSSFLQNMDPTQMDIKALDNMLRELDNIKATSASQ